MSDRFTKTDLEKAKEATKRIRDKRAQKRMKNSRPEKKGSSITDIFKSYGKYDGKPIELQGGGMSAGQKKIAAKAPPPNKIDAKDFAVLRAEKAKGRGMGLQDEKVQPGKVMKAKRGKFLRSDPTKPISSVKPLGKLGGAGSMKVSKAHSSVLGKISANKLREMVKTGMNPDLKGDPNIKRGSQKTSMEAKSTLDKVNKKNSSEFLKRRKELGAAGKALSATRIGKIALGVGAAGVAAQQYLKSKMKKKDEPKKKMGGGMMQKPMGYSKGTSVTVKCKLGRNKPTKIT